MNEQEISGAFNDWVESANEHLQFKFPLTTGPSAPGWLAILSDKDSQYSKYICGQLKAKLKTSSQIKGYMDYTGGDEGDPVYDKLDMAMVISWLLNQGWEYHVCPAVILYHSLFQETDPEIREALIAVGIAYDDKQVIETMKQFNI